MDCIDCDGNTKVLDTVKYEGVVYRKRKCPKCGNVFGTLEDVCDMEDKYFIKAFRYRSFKSAKGRRKKDKEWKYD